MKEIKMERRLFLGTLAAASLPLNAADAEDWVVIADAGVNLNRHHYSGELIDRMAGTAKGLFVMKSESMPVEDGRITDAVGICLDARVSGGQLQCRFGWFGGRKPKGMTVTPQGVATCFCTPFGYDAIDKDYRLTSFSLNPHSGFAVATRV